MNLDARTEIALFVGAATSTLLSRSILEYRKGDADVKLQLALELQLGVL